MKLRVRALLVTFFTMLFSIAQSQENSGITFNRVKPEDFSIKNYTVDTSLGAVVVADIGKSYFEGNRDGYFTLVHELKRRIKIIDKKGFDLATIRVKLYKSKENKEEKLEKLKATTYNLEDGKIIETKINKDDVFMDKVNENFILKKFTMPAVKEGSIIEYSYTIKSEFLFNLQPWSFQGNYPILWSEYEVSIPDFFKYVTLTHGYLPFHIKKSDVVAAKYLISEQNASNINGNAGFKTENFSIEAINVISRWAIKDVPALKEEKFTSSLENHISAIEFQLAAFNFPNSPYKPYMGSWQTVTEELLKDEDFGADLTRSNKWVSNDITLSAKSDVNVDEARRVFKYVQDNFKNKGSRGFYLSQPLKETYKNKSGYVADINLLLTLILKNKGFNASPVLLSTRSNGTALEIYPLINKFNYVICKLSLDNVNYYLDASQSFLGFNKLASYCYNGTARAVNKTFDAEYFIADSLNEAKTTNVLLMLDNDNPKNWLGWVQTKLGYNESSTTRQSITDKGKEEYIKRISQTYTGDLKISDIELIKLDKIEEEMMIKYNIDVDNNNRDIIYFSPLLHEGMGENPFKSQNRMYPVEMPYKINETYSLTLPIPIGYVIDELPQSERIMFNEDEGMFEYLVYKSDKEINIKTFVKLNKATFVNEDYESLRQFFDHVVRKHAEQIVLKKK